MRFIPADGSRDAPTIVQFMKRRDAVGAHGARPDQGGADRVTCETCHGRTPERADWQMPAVAALPLPDVRTRGWEAMAPPMDAQMRNAIYGYIAEPDKQARATYMREVVMPGMARLLHRRPYDFTRSYAYNRQRVAFGCYHCHKVQ